MSPHAEHPTRVLVYGSCVARDTIEFADSSGVDLRGYVARQSLLSAGSDASSHLPESMSVSSKFQERMIRADFAGIFPERLASMTDTIDVLLWDLTDERHGVHRFPDGTVVTRSIDTMRVDEIAKELERATHIPFGSNEHFSLWRERVDAFEQQLRALSLFQRTIVLEVPWAILTVEGKPSPWSMGVRAKDANERFRRYYDLLRVRGFRMVVLSDADVLADPAHRWGLAPFHYTDAVYRELLRQLNEEQGLASLRPAAN